MALDAQPKRVVGTMLPRFTASPVPGNLTRGCSDGAFVYAMFGSLWWWLAASNAGRGTIGSAAAILTGCGLLVGASIVLRRLGKTLANAPSDRAVWQAFAWVNVAQWIVIGAISELPDLAGKEDWLPAMLALVVGLHFFPVGYMFRARVQYVTGAAMVLTALAFNRHYVAVSASCGVILWASAIYNLGVGFSVARRGGVAARTSAEKIG